MQPYHGMSVKLGTERDVSKFATEQGSVRVGYLLGYFSSMAATTASFSMGLNEQVL